MKKMFKILLFLLIALFLWFPSLHTQSEYDKYVSQFNLITVESIEERANNYQSTLVYIGRETCPYCVEFVPMLNRVSNKRKLDVFYLDTEEETESIKLFREKHQIIYVPSLLYITQEGEIIYPNIPENEHSLEDLLIYLQTQ